MKPEDIEIGVGNPIDLWIGCKSQEEAEALKKQILEALEFYEKFSKVTWWGRSLKEFEELKDKAEKWDKVTGLSWSDENDLQKR